MGGELPVGCLWRASSRLNVGEEAERTCWSAVGCEAVVEQQRTVTRMAYIDQCDRRHLSVLPVEDRCINTARDDGGCRGMAVTAGSTSSQLSIQPGSQQRATSN